MSETDSPDQPALPAGINEQIVFWLELLQSGVVAPPAAGITQAFRDLADAGFTMHFGVGPAAPAKPPDEPVT
jgi:hypothetical protein